MEQAAEFSAGHSGGVARTSRPDHERSRVLPPAAGGTQKVQESCKGLWQSAELFDCRHCVPEEDEARRGDAGGPWEERELRAHCDRGGEPHPGGAE